MVWIPPTHLLVEVAMPALTLEAAMLGVAMAAAVAAVVAASIRAFFACTRYLERLLTFGCGLTTSW
jgi:hypothetical protein